MKKATPLLIAALMAAGCSSAPERSDEAIVRTAVPMSMSPNSGLDTTRGDNTTTIELLKEKAQEIVELKKKNRELQDALKEASSIAKAEEGRARSQAEQVRRLQSLLAKITSEQSTFNDRILSLEIEKHELEKKILNMKMAALASEGN